MLTFSIPISLPAFHSPSYTPAMHVLRCTSNKNRTLLQRVMIFCICSAVFSTCCRLQQGSRATSMLCLVLSTLTLMTFVVQCSAEEACGKAASCADCLMRDDGACGWCSGNLRTLNGTWTNRKCFRAVDYGAEVVCFDMMSVDVCVPGYECNATAGQCQQTPPGEGTTFGHCAGTCNCTEKGCDRFSCSGGVNDMFFCEFDPVNGTITLAECRNTCGVSAGTPVPTPGNCTPACTVPCDPHRETCCPRSRCSYDFVWNDFRCHPDGKFC